jgi:hypothetical protein
LVLLLDPRSGIDKNQDLGSGINIPDPQHTTGFSQIVQQLARMPHTSRTETENAAHLSLLQENAFEMTSRQLLDFWSFFSETLAALEQENCASVPYKFITKHQKTDLLQRAVLWIGIVLMPIRF